MSANAARVPGAAVNRTEHHSAPARLAAAVALPYSAIDHMLASSTVPYQLR